MHRLKHNNPKLYQQLVKAADITDEQRDAYLEREERNDLYTDAAIDDEIIADQMEDVAKRTGLLQSIAGKNRGLIQRVVQWLKDTMNKFIDHFRNPDGKLTTNQSIALADEFGRIAKDLVDPNGQKIFRYNRRTHNIELADGRNLAENEKAATEDELPQGYRTESGRPLSQSNAREFIVDEDGNRDMGEISKEIEQKTNGTIKSAPVRLQVGHNGMGYRHIVERHLSNIKGKSFQDPVSYVKHILKNFNQIYQAVDKEGNPLPNRIILYCKRDQSKGYMPIELEVAKSDNGKFYTIITAYPKDKPKKKTEKLLFDGSATPSSVAATDSLMKVGNDNAALPPGAPNAKSNFSNENITQNEEPVKYSIGNDNSSESLTRKINSKTYTVKGRGLK